MEDYLSRTAPLLGAGAMKRLKNSRVAVFGIGGVGGYVVEALVRSGVGAIDLIDNDTISASNINRQIIALESTVGQRKTDAAAKRARDINPDVEIRRHNIFFMPDTADIIDFSQYDYVADAIDTVTGKIEIVARAKKAGIGVISAMGTGNKLNPSLFEIDDIYNTSVCPLARVMRRELKARGIKDLKVVYSKEEAKKIFVADGERRAPGSIAFVPAAAGLIMAGEIIHDIAGDI